MKVQVSKSGSEVMLLVQPTPNDDCIAVTLTLAEAELLRACLVSSESCKKFEFEYER